MNPVASQRTDFRSDIPRTALFQRSQTFSGDVRFLNDIVEESLLVEQGSHSCSCLRKAATDPGSACRDFTVDKRRILSLPHDEQIFSLKLDYDENIGGRSLVRKLLSEHPGDLFLQKLDEIVASDPFQFRRENISHPLIASPTKRSLELSVEAYRRKYGMNIRLSTLDQLPGFLEETKAEVLKVPGPPRYMSFIIANTERDMESGHVVPLLCFFARASTKSPVPESLIAEFLIMDVMGLAGPLAAYIRLLLCDDTSPENIYMASGARQADVYSCRTGALSLLRNTHLSLEFHRYQDGIRRPLERLVPAPFDPDKCVLPSEWTYVEQVFRGARESLAIRDCFSAKVSKRAHPRTVEVFRRAHTEPVRFCCTLFSTKDYSTAFHSLRAPEGVEVEISRRGFRMKFEISVDVNTYLLHKGFQRAGLRKS